MYFVIDFSFEFYELNILILMPDQKPVNRCCLRR
jgi:hypothetical protein